MTESENKQPDERAAFEALRYIDAQLTEYLEGMPADETSRKLRDVARAASQPTAKCDEHLRGEIAQTPVQQGDSVTSDDVGAEGGRSPIIGDRQPYRWRDTGALETGEAE